MSPRTFRASSLPALAECPCFVPDNETRDFQEAGTDRHAALHDALNGDDDLLNLLDGEDHEGVTWALAYIKFNTPVDSKPTLEKRLTYTDRDFILSGQPDVVWENQIFDLKWRPRNYKAQLAAYGFLLMKNDVGEFSFEDKPPKGVYDCTECVIHVLYAQAKRAVKYTMDVTELYNEIFPILQVASSPQALPIPNPYCGWCANKLTCPAFSARVLEIARQREDWKIEHYHPSEITNPREMSKALDLAPLMEKWCESVRFHAREMVIKQGLSLPGYGLASQERRTIPDIAKAFKLSDLPPELFLTACKVTLGELEGLYALKHDISKVKAKEFMNRLLAPAIEHTTVQILKKV